MGQKRVGNYKPRTKRAAIDFNRETRNGFVSYFSLPENARLFTDLYRKEPTEQNIQSAYDKITRYENGGS
jgi:hypothetical protein